MHVGDRIDGVREGEVLAKVEVLGNSRLAHVLVEVGVRLEGQVPVVVEVPRSGRVLRVRVLVDVAGM